MSDLDLQARRLEQQISAFEMLHADELRRFESQLATYRQLQADELNQLRGHLQHLKDDIAAVKAREAEAATRNPPPVADLEPVQLTVSRRDLLTGNLPSAAQKRA